MKVAIYSRKSKLSEKGESIQNQIEMCTEYAVRNFSAPEEDIIIYEDEGYSGKDTERPGFSRMIAEAEGGTLDVVICYKLDRISRNVCDFSATLEILNRNNVSFVSITERFDTSNPIGRAMMYISSVFAQLERETTAERVRDNLRRLARTGRWLGGTAPAGYASEAVEYIGNALEKKKMMRLAPVQDELATVKMIYNKYLEFESICRLYAYLAQSNVKSRRGNYFCQRALRIILENPVYVRADERVYGYFLEKGCDITGCKDDFNGRSGLIVYGRRDQSTKGKNKQTSPAEWIVAVGGHEGVIDARDWLTVQEKLEEGAGRAPREGQGGYSLLNSLIVCGGCGSKMSVSFRKGAKASKPHYYYRCRKKNETRGALCSFPNVGGRVADRAVLEELRKLSKPHDRQLIKELASLRDRYESADDKQKERTKLQKEIKVLRRRIGSLTEVLSESDNKSIAKYIIEAIEKHDADIRANFTKLDKLKCLTERLPESVDTEYFRKLYEFPAEIDSLGVTEAKLYIKELVKTVVWDGTGLEIVLRL